MTDASYRASPTKRARRTKAEIEAIKAAMYEELAANHPMTVRQVFYQLASRGEIAKSEAEYKGTVCRLLADMRRSGEVPYTWLADATRWMRKPTTYSSAEDALRRTAETYRQALWDDAAVAVEIWLEKEALAGVLVEATDEWDVPLMVTRGYPSMSFLYSAAEAIRDRHTNGGQRTHIYYLGDHDPSGVDIDRAVVKGIGEALVSIVSMQTDKPRMDWWMAARFFDSGDLGGLLKLAEEAGSVLGPFPTFKNFATFTRIAVTEEQIEGWDLPTRPTKRTDTRSKNFKGESVEVDAIPPEQLRRLATEAIEQHVDHHQLGLLRVVEAEERAGMEKMAEWVGR